MKHVNLLILTLLSTMFIALPSGAWQLTDVYPDDMNIITSQSLGEYGPELDIWEDYHEDNLTPYFEIPFNRSYNQK